MHAGTVLGQAACFDSYSLEDGTVVRFDADPDSPTEASPEAIAAAEVAVEEQAAAVRELKEQEGMTNKSLEVQARSPHCRPSTAVLPAAGALSPLHFALSPRHFACARQHGCT